MYFLNEIEKELLVRKILQEVRENAVTDNLRGSAWHESPLKPYYEGLKLPMYLACSTYCQTRRDAYACKVMKISGERNREIQFGLFIHRLVPETINAFRMNPQETPEFETLNKKVLDAEKIEQKHHEEFTRNARAVFDATLNQLRERLSAMKASQPRMTGEDAMLTSVPFLVEHKVSGELLGLSENLSIDCYDYLRNIVFDLKVGVQNARKDDRLYPTGYAMVLESIYEIPVNIGCTVYVGFTKEGQLTVRKDIFAINDELRSWWVEERDKKLEIIGEEKDPGRADACDKNCPYLEACKNESTGN